MTTTPAPTDIDAIRARLLNATDGPWAIWPDLRPNGLITIGDATGVIPEGETWTDGPSNTIAHVYTDEDADFIVRAPEDIRALLDELATERRQGAAMASITGEAIRQLGEERDAAREELAKTQALLERAQNELNAYRRGDLPHAVLEEVRRLDSERTAELAKTRAELASRTLWHYYATCGYCGAKTGNTCRDMDNDRTPRPHPHLSRDVLANPATTAEPAQQVCVHTHCQLNQHETVNIAEATAPITVTHGGLVAAPNTTAEPAANHAHTTHGHSCCDQGPAGVGTNLYGEPCGGPGPCGKCTGQARMLHEGRFAEYFLKAEPADEPKAIRCCPRHREPGEARYGCATAPGVTDPCCDDCHYWIAWNRQLDGEDDAEPAAS